MQDEDVRQVDTNDKWLQFAHCLPPFLCVVLFSQVKMSPKWGISTDHAPIKSSSEGSQDNPACLILAHYCHVFSRKYWNHKFELFHWVNMAPKLAKLTDRDQNLIWWLGYINWPYLRSFPRMFSRKCPQSLNLARFAAFFGLCDLAIWHMSLEIWETQAVGVSKLQTKYQSNRWCNMLAKAVTGGQSDRRSDRQRRLWISLPQLKCHTLHMIKPNKWPKHR